MHNCNLCCPALSGSLWLSLALSGSLSGSLWLSLALSGSLWLPLALSGSLWLSIALQICLPSPCSAHKALAQLGTPFLSSHTLISPALLDRSHVPATTGQSCQKKKVPFSQMNISLLANFGLFFGKKRIFGPFSAFRQNVKTAVSP